MDDLRNRLSEFSSALDASWAKLDLDKKLSHLDQLEEEVSQPELWTNPENARRKNEEFAKLSDEIHPWKVLRAQTTDLSDLIELGGDDLTKEIESQLSAMESTLEDLKKSLKFTEPYDNHDAILRITSGVGGVEAMDWASMLERMYLRFCEKQGIKATCLERTTGEEAGIKTAVYELKGPNVYGLLKSEHGVHRLVRLSPFNADNLRQTSFALVEVIPAIKPDDDIKIDEKDLRIDVYHSGGHGGQSVNTTNSAVRITHLPTNTVVAIQNERSQLQNKEKAMEILRGKLIQMQQEQHAENLNELRAGESAKWGQQIRNYILQPYKLVKDTRTKHEEKDPDSILDGNIMPFINAYLDLS